MPRKVTSRRGVVTYVWDDGMAVDAQVQLANAQVVDVLQIVGQAGEGFADGDGGGECARGRDDERTLTGGGHVSLLNGVAYGEPYESAVADLTVQGKDVEANTCCAAAAWDADCG